MNINKFTLWASICILVLAPIALLVKSLEGSTPNIWFSIIAIMWAAYMVANLIKIKGEE